MPLTEDGAAGSKAGGGAAGRLGGCSRDGAREGFEPTQPHRTGGSHATSAHARDGRRAQPSARGDTRGIRAGDESEPRKETPTRSGP